jgi:hypothetical protein
MVNELLKRLVVPKTKTEWILQGMTFYNIGIFLIMWAYGAAIGPF